MKKRARDTRARRSPPPPRRRCHPRHRLVMVVVVAVIRRRRFGVVCRCNSQCRFPSPRLLYMLVKQQRTRNEHEKTYLVQNIRDVDVSSPSSSSSPFNSSFSSSSDRCRRHDGHHWSLDFRDGRGRGQR